MTRDQAASEVKSASSLWTLLDALRELESTIDRTDEDQQQILGAYGIDIAELPNFGGPEPASTLEVWSWDADSVLVGTGPFSEWHIVDRP